MGNQHSTKNPQWYADYFRSGEKTMNLNYQRIGDGGLIQVATLLRTTTHIHRLELVNNSIGIIGIRAIADALHSNPRAVKELDLSSNPVGDAGAEEIARVLASKTLQLTWLSLGTSNISDKGARALAKALETNEWLETLYLVYNSVSDDGAKLFARSLKKNTTLKAFSLWNNHVGDDGARAIIDALENGNTKLQRLYLEDNPISTELVDHLGSLMDRRSLFTENQQDYLTKLHISNIDDIESNVDVGILTCEGVPNSSIAAAQYPRSQRLFVFLSQTNSDKTRELLSRPTRWFIRNKLGLEVFLDESDTTLGNDKRREILSHAFQCTHAIAFLSPEYRSREFCVRELNTFVHRQQRGDEIQMIIAMRGISNKELHKSYASKVGDFIRLDTTCNDHDGVVDYLLTTLWPALIKVFQPDASWALQELEQCLLSHIRNEKKMGRTVPKCFHYFERSKNAKL